MTFIHPLLLGGLIFVGVPILLHLIMRQKPKHLLFPAVRFLLQRHRTNQRKLQLRHLLLLAMRMGLIALACLALARPRIFSERLNLVSYDRPVAAVLVFDTSPSMEYRSGGKTRLEEAQRRGQELLADLPQNSQVAVFDTAEQGDELHPLSLARERIAALQIRPANYPVTGQLAHAYDLLAKRLQEQENPAETPLLFLYVFSDRTQACWDFSQVENLKRLRDRVPTPGVNAVFVDVGIDKPEDLAIANLEMPKQLIPVDRKAEIRATVRATGSAYEPEIICRVDGEEVGRKSVKLDADQSQVVVFEKRNPSQGPHQVEVALRATDSSLTFDDARFASFEVRGRRQVLTITDDPDGLNIWELALKAGDAFTADVKPTRDVVGLGPKDLAKYQAVCLINVHEPSNYLWQVLDKYVQDGGGLAIIPGGEDMDEEPCKKAYNADPTAQALLPGRLEKVVKSEGVRGAQWDAVGFRHPIIAPFREWGQAGTVDFFKQGQEPAAKRYWQITPRDAKDVIVRYADKDKRPALLERSLDKKYRGRVLLFTTPLDDDRCAPRDLSRQWNNYVQMSFYLVLVQQTVGYLAGDAEEGNFNFTCGQSVPVALPPDSRAPTYTIQNPSLPAAEALVARGANENELHITKAVAPGNYGVIDPRGKRIAGFSLNVAPEEAVLARVPPEQVEALFGAGAVLPVDAKVNLRDALLDRWSQPVELLPWLMILILLLLAVENLFANKFYKQDKGEEPAAVKGGAA
jgi:uncharacterized membrane protein